MYLLVFLLPPPSRLWFCRCLSVCLFVCLSACLLATLRKKFQTDWHEIVSEDWQWTNEQMIKFWWRSGSGIRIRIRLQIVTLVRHALAEVCTLPVLLVLYCFNSAFCLCTKCHACRFEEQLDAALPVQGRSFVDELSPQNFLSQNRAPCEDDFETIKLISNGAYGYI